MRKKQKENIKSDEVCSWKIAKELKELGVPQESMWYWQWNGVAGHYFLRTKKEIDNSVYPYEHYYSAFTVTESCKELPKSILVKNYICVLFIQTGNLGWNICYTNYSGRYGSPDIYDQVLANACAKMRIFLIKGEKLKKEDKYQ